VVDRLGLEVGYRLVPLVDKHQDGELLRRIRGIRKKIAQDLGFLVPAVHIRDNLQLKPNAYRVTLKGVSVAEGEAIAGKFLAINPGRVLGGLNGQAATDPKPRCVIRPKPMAIPWWMPVRWWRRT
jgi:flagellar biosynthesis protein FlhA